MSLPEEPATIETAVRYLHAVPEVDRTRISLVGISIGASMALVAASADSIANDVHAVIFFGGFYEIEEYLLSLATGTMVVEAAPVAWDAHPDAIGDMRQILEAKDATWMLSIFDAGSRAEAERLLRVAPDRELMDLHRYSPAAHARETGARLFVLHDRGDRFVPHVESIRLQRAWPGRVEAFLLSNVFQHAQFKQGSNLEFVADLAALYNFVTRAFGYVDR
jgi:hypothetical protein